jgi:hypothetical protein
MLQHMNEASEAAKVLCPNYREAIILLDAVKSYADLGEYFEAGVWWREVFRPLDLIKDRELQVDIQKRMAHASEEICSAQRQALVRQAGPRVQGVPCACPEDAAKLPVGLPHAGRRDDRHVLADVPSDVGTFRQKATSARAR